MTFITGGGKPIKVPKASFIILSASSKSFSFIWRASILFEVIIMIIPLQSAPKLNCSHQCLGRQNPY
ncbi:MAG: hypothetical protein M3136_08240 [Thermoproteota archaeon]|nr:hypothetical protein [Thermoproteota archaeon]